MTTPAVAASAERLNRIRSGESLADVYGETPQPSVLDRHHSDEYAVINAYLAEHPADDSEPITEEWLLAIGGRSGTAPAGCRFYEFGEVNEATGYTWLRVHSPMESEGECIVDLCSGGPDGQGGTGITRNWPKTRGDLRRLCAALGIDLASPAVREAGE